MKEALIKIFICGERPAQTTGAKQILTALFRFSHLTIRYSILVLALGFNAIAQDDQYEQTEPPPLKIVSKAEIAQLSAESNLSDRTKLSLAMSEARLKKAEELYTKESYREMFVELGGFHALIDEALVFLNKRDNGTGKVLNNFKRIEINLRQYIPRVELIRRELPARYEPYVRGLIKNLRAARSRAVEPLFDDSVIPSGKQGN